MPLEELEVQTGWLKIRAQSDLLNRAMAKQIIVADANITIITSIARPYFELESPLIA